MANDARYTHEKLAVAVTYLVRGQGRIRERLREAYIEQAHLAGPARGLSKETNRRLEEFHAQMNRVQATGEEGTATATVNTMSEDEAVTMAAEIESLAGQVGREIDEMEAGRKK